MKCRKNTIAILCLLWNNNNTSIHVCTYVYIYDYVAWFRFFLTHALFFLQNKQNTPKNVKFEHRCDYDLN